MFINQNLISACFKYLNLNSLGFAKINRMVRMSRLAIGVALLFSSAQVMMAGPRDNQNSNDEVSKTQQDRKSVV